MLTQEAQPGPAFLFLIISVFSTVEAALFFSPNMAYLTDGGPRLTIVTEELPTTALESDAILSGCTHYHAWP